MAVFFLSFCQVFGSKSAPLNFSRFPAWMCEIMAHSFAAPVTHCVDDMLSVERLATVDSAREAWLVLSQLCGWALSMDKSPPPAVRFAAIGVMLVLEWFPGGEIVIKVTEKRIQTLEERLLY